MTFGGRGEMWPIIGQLDQAAAATLLRLSIDAGINFFDTADVYSEGESERILGGAIKDLGIARKDIIIATKVRGRTGQGPNAVGLSRGHILDAVKDSLARLGTDYIDLYQIHGADLVTPIDETLRALDDLVRAGRVSIFRRLSANTPTTLSMRFRRSPSGTACQWRGSHSRGCCIRNR
jgi:aryl-alcohol dehydrogenase-like predicted oxidoreductase